MVTEAPIVIREPAAAEIAGFESYQATARIQTFIDNKTVKATTQFTDWYIGEMVAIESQTPGVGIVGFLEVTGLIAKPNGTYELIGKLQRQSRVNFIQIGDSIIHLDLSSENEKYLGTTDLLIQRPGGHVSAKYKPIYTQGVAVGETAETLWPGEYLITWYGQVNYGWKDWLTVNTVVPGNFLGAPNAGAKARIFESTSNIVAIGTNVAKIPNKSQTSMNLNIYWDSLSSESMLSHTLFSIALFTFEEAEKATAVKSLGTSSFQTGHEFILDNWDRVLLGPSYNFEKNAVGGYLTYVKIWDTFHMSISLNSTDVSSLKFSPENGYYLLADAYWRF